jgi:hypothetical protein
MLFGMFLMFMLLAAGAGALTWFIWLRLGDHLKENEEGVRALTKHLLVPLMGKKAAEAPEPPPQPGANPET